MKRTRKLGALCYSSLSVSSTEQNLTAFIIWQHAEAADSRIKMTTATPLINNTQFSVNVTTKSQEQSLYQSSGAIVAAIVVGVIIVFTWLLLILNPTYNRRMRVKRELEPKTTKTAMPLALGQNSNSMSQASIQVTFIPVDLHMQEQITGNARSSPVREERWNSYLRWIWDSSAKRCCIWNSNELVILSIDCNYYLFSLFGRKNKRSRMLFVLTEINWWRHTNHQKGSETFLQSSGYGETK
ncbi:LOW QUALITY PROTEIN: noncompact myelin-associated protein [Ciconia maguari]